jgi:hypothetical protein
MRIAHRRGRWRAWRVAIIRKRGEYLGTVEAVDKEAAEAAAVKAFDLTDEQRKRLVVQEQRARPSPAPSCWQV